MTNIKNMNFDDIVFFRHKEVIVYPDDVNKPELGQGLNKKAQVTLDKVWPVDKSSGSPIKNADKLLQLNYEEKLQKACIKLGEEFLFAYSRWFDGIFTGFFDFSFRRSVCGIQTRDWLVGL